MGLKQFITNLKTKHEERKKEKKNERLKWQANYEIQQMKNESKHYLKTGVSRTKAKSMLINGIITQEQYDDIIKNIEMLEMLSTFDLNNIPNNQQPNETQQNPNIEVTEVPTKKENPPK